MKEVLLFAGACAFISFPVSAASLNLNLGLTQRLTSATGAVVGRATTATTAVGQLASGNGAAITQDGSGTQGAALVGQVLGVNTAAIGRAATSQYDSVRVSAASRPNYADAASSVQFGPSTSLLSN